MIRRLYVQKKPGFTIEEDGILSDLKTNLGINVKSLEILNRYDIEGLTDEDYTKAKNIVFADPAVDNVFEENIDMNNKKVFAMEYLPGQYDQRADSAIQCVQIVTEKDNCNISVAKIFLLDNSVSDTDLEKIKEYCINPVESRIASLEKPTTLKQTFNIPTEVENLNGFTSKTKEELAEFHKNTGLAMTVEDILHVQKYFKDEEKREPTITEIRVLDTYWSDHCRHTTFLTHIKDVKIDDGKFAKPIKEAYELYLDTKKKLNNTKDVCLMDIATIGMKELKKLGKLDDLDESEEINACSIKVDAKINGKIEKWLVMFKNETHNHPTEIEPFGGAATCLGGAIRDPLSGRSYVYQAMRITGAGDPRTPINETIKGKLPQRKITTGAAAGYSSYGNQIGLTTGQVAEIYNPGFVAKRMELGAVVGAAPAKNVVRETPMPGDVVILLGGRTGRDGIGGATGSSKEHNEDSINECGAEVQKGNALTERKIQRLFRKSEATTLIKRCNDFGAGGVSVAIGELSDGIKIDLDKVKKKYEGLDGTEIAISESQERMAVVIAKKDVEEFINYAKEENLETTEVAIVTEEPRIVMNWEGKEIVNLSREFLNTNGAKQVTNAHIVSPVDEENYFTKLNINEKGLKEMWVNALTDINSCSQKGLVERFDSTIGMSTVTMPFGGKNQLTPAEGMTALLPLLDGETSTATVFAYGYNPKIALFSPFHGAVFAVVETVAKITAMGGDYTKTRLSLQEFFERLKQDEVKWGKPLSGLLGAYYMQHKLQIPAIGGKDSMSGTFKDINVPPTVVSFGIVTEDAENLISSEFKKVGSKVVYIPLTRDEYELPNFEVLNKNYKKIYELILGKKIISASTIKQNGIAETVSKMCFGNEIGFEFTANMTNKELFSHNPGSIIVEISETEKVEDILSGVDYKVLGNTVQNAEINVNNEKLLLKDLVCEWEKPLESVFPTPKQINKDINIGVTRTERAVLVAKSKIARPKVFIPAFPGTNCEVDSAKAFRKAGADVETFIFKNADSNDVKYSIETIKKHIENSNIIMLPGGFSAGDEPDGSGKFIAAVFKNPYIKEAVMDLLENRDGLMIGICNGFQALIKLGLVPYGRIQETDASSPTLTLNKIGRHISGMVNTKIITNKSPWLHELKEGDIHTIPVSHGEGRFVASNEMLQELIRYDQIATRYCPLPGQADALNQVYNPNGSTYEIEGILSPDGRVLGKMGHSERTGKNLYKNIVGNTEQKIFESGVNYYK